VRYRPADLENLTTARKPAEVGDVVKVPSGRVGVVRKLVTSEGGKVVQVLVKLDPLMTRKTRAALSEKVGELRREGMGKAQAVRVAYQELRAGTLSSSSPRSKNPRGRTLTVDVDSPHTVTGPRSRALEAYKRDGVALWLRADGSARLFYRDPGSGRMRQVTWGATTLKRRDNPALQIIGNPRGSRRFSKRVRRLEYLHEHGHPGEIMVHDFGPGVEMFALEDGSIRLSHPRKRLWDTFPD